MRDVTDTSQAVEAVVIAPAAAEEERDVIENPYSPMVDEARDNLLRMMHNTDNEKLSKDIAIEILDRAGETKRAEANASVMVNIQITDGDMNLMLATVQEVKDGR